MGLVFEILLPLVFYLVCYCHEGFVKPFAGLIFVFQGSFHSYFACKIDSFPKRLWEPKRLLNGGSGSGSGSLKNPGAGAVWLRLRLRLYSPGLKARRLVQRPFYISNPCLICNILLPARFKEPLTCVRLNIDGNEYKNWKNN